MARDFSSLPGTKIPKDSSVSSRFGIMDENFLRVAVLLLLLKGTHERDVFDELTERDPTSSPGD